MKTHINLPAYLLSCFFVVFAACLPEDEDDTVTPDAAASIEGTYLLNDYNVRLYGNGASDTSYLVVSKPRIAFKTDTQIGAGKARTDLRELIEETVNEFYRTSPVTVTFDAKNIDPDKMIVEKEAGNSFKIQEFPFDGEFTSGGIKDTYPCYFKAEGRSEHDKINLHFILTVDTGAKAFFESKAEGKKFAVL